MSIPLDTYSTEKLVEVLAQKQAIPEKDRTNIQTQIIEAIEHELGFRKTNAQQ
jgi:hypothetical protein